MEAPQYPHPELPDSLRAGVFANFFGVSGGASEVVLDFGAILPEPATGGEASVRRNVIVSRVIVSRSGAEKLRDLLVDVLARSASTEAEPSESGGES